ncbi:hypothetical protein JCM10914A_35650 [Paenibacillus sp. JCM 10914]|uniref:hypothetical protein n=1 Tax=Paenibacillus sp. JCM 10914 TaxID=1236974 RepID=UPI0009DDBB91|nr:hypothetical protein [Paenibacillus sp. JCM 10914]
MSCGCNQNPCPHVSPIVCDPIVVIRDHFVPQIVPVIHPIKVVDKVHCVPVEQHIYTYSEEEVIGGVGGPGGVLVSGKSSKKRASRTTRSRRK